jgi:3-phosphoshikimate 1-carboxyvinyltransferase
MQTYTISKGDRNLSAEITLNPSKSISKRNIFIRVLKDSRLNLKSLSEKDASNLIDQSIRKGNVALDQGDPAKAIRFLGSFFAYFKGEWIITGSDEMKKRPVGDVIEMLQSKGHNIKYLERDGFPALKIIGKGFKGKITRIDATICSQFISANLLISQTLPTEDMIALKNWISSSPFISQTIRLLNYLGVNVDWVKEDILVEHELHDGNEMSVEADWTAASYWYQMAALSSNANIVINGLNIDSVQSDAIVKEIFEPLGVKTISTGKGVEIKSVKRKINFFEYDFSNNPDLVPSIVTTCVALKIPFKFTGIQQLRHKDSDRVMALQSQMARLGAKLKVEKKGDQESFSFDGKATIPSKGSMSFNTFGDHRMVMSITPLAILGVNVSVDEPRVVSKSYPCFWDDVKKVGLLIEQSSS